jgi:hypothetical protein
MLGKDSDRFAGFLAATLVMGLPILRKLPRQQSATAFWTGPNTEFIYAQIPSEK